MKSPLSGDLLRAIRRKLHEAGSTNDPQEATRHAEVVEVARLQVHWAKIAVVLSMFSILTAFLVAGIQIGIDRLFEAQDKSDDREYAIRQMLAEGASLRGADLSELDLSEVQAREAVLLSSIFVKHPSTTAIFGVRIWIVQTFALPRSSKLI